MLKIVKKTLKILTFFERVPSAVALERNPDTLFFLRAPPRCMLPDRSAPEDAAKPGSHVKCHELTQAAEVLTQSLYLLGLHDKQLSTGAPTRLNLSSASSKNKTRTNPKP